MGRENILGAIRGPKRVPFGINCLQTIEFVPSAIRTMLKFCGKVSLAFVGVTLSGMWSFISKVHFEMLWFPPQIVHKVSKDEKFISSLNN